MCADAIGVPTRQTRRRRCLYLSITSPTCGYLVPAAHAVHSTHRLCAAPPPVDAQSVLPSLPHDPFVRHDPSGLLRAPTRPPRHRAPTPGPCPSLQRCGGGSAALQQRKSNVGTRAWLHPPLSCRVLPPPHATLLGSFLRPTGIERESAPAQTVRGAEASTVGALGRASAGPHLCGASQRSTPSCRRGVCLAKCSSARPTHFPLRKRSGMKCPAPWRQL